MKAPYKNRTLDLAGHHGPAIPRITGRPNDRAVPQITCDNLCDMLGWRRTGPVFSIPNFRLISINCFQLLSRRTPRITPAIKPIFQLSLFFSFYKLHKHRCRLHNNLCYSCTPVGVSCTIIEVSCTTTGVSIGVYIGFHKGGKFSLTTNTHKSFPIFYMAKIDFYCLWWHFIWNFIF